MSLYDYNKKLIEVVRSLLNDNSLIEELERVKVKDRYYKEFELDDKHKLRIIIFRVESYKYPCTRIEICRKDEERKISIVREAVRNENKINKWLVEFREEDYELLESIRKNKDKINRVLEKVVIELSF